MRVRASATASAEVLAGMLCSIFPGPYRYMPAIDRSRTMIAGGRFSTPTLATSLAVKLAGPRQYQWMRGGLPLIGEIGPTLRLSDAYPETSGVSLCQDGRAETRSLTAWEVCVALLGVGAMEEAEVVVKVRPEPALTCVVWGATGVAHTESAVVTLPSALERVEAIRVHSNNRPAALLRKCRKNGELPLKNDDLLLNVFGL